MPSLEELRERFREDRYAAQLTGVNILEAEPGRSLAGLRLRPDHLNANHKVMGGAVFTLADFAFAVAANSFSERTTVSQHVSITFLAPARGQELLAEARCVKTGRTTCLYEVEVWDEAGTLVAMAMVNGFTL